MQKLAQQSQCWRCLTLWVCGLLILSGSACSNTNTPVGKAETGTDTGQPFNIDGLVNGDSQSTDTSDADTSGLDELGYDNAGPLDTPNYDVTANCPGGALCPCSANTDCQSGLCLEDSSAGGGKACAQACKPACAPGYVCANLTSGSSDIQQFCVDQAARLCDPCNSSKDCEVVGLLDSKCVDQGELGRFCGVACLQDEECPAGYGCQQVGSVEGGKFKQCVRSPAKGSAAVFGECSCSASAVKKQLSTACFAGGNTGPAGAKCPGVRACGANGLSACNAPTPATETCDGADNDCDGQTDEATCDDKLPCTQDVCDGKGSCVFTFVSGPGCDLAKGCTQVSDNGKPCEADNDLCTQGDLCANGVCNVGKAVQCDDGKPCTTNGCDKKTGQCAASAVDDGVPCNDGTKCTEKDECKVGVCKGKAVACGDDNACTEDNCDAKVGCEFSPTSAACNDANACTTGDACQGSKGCIGQPVDISTTCSDNNKCTVEGCDPLLGCVNSATTLNCDDANPCTLDVCDPLLGCGHTPNPEPIKCGDQMQCAAGVCAVKLVAVDVATGDGHSCALLSTGKVACWGSIWNYSLGGSLFAQTAPEVVDGLPSKAISICARSGRTGALLEDGTVWNWGLIGMDDYNAKWIASAKPVKVVGLPAKATQISCGNGFGCARVASGEVWCWGLGSGFQLGGGKPTSSQVAGKVIGLPLAATKIGLGESHACAILADSSVFCWGASFFGAAFSLFTVPTKVSPAAGPCLEITGGATHTCCATASKPVCWGDNSLGQTGTKTIEPNPGYVDGLGSLVSSGIGCGTAHSCVVGKSGGVACWGDNNFAQLGSNLAGGPIPQDAGPFFESVSKLAAGSQHNCALTASGSVLCWGRAGRDQLGDGVQATKLAPSTYVVSKAPIQALAGGDSRTCAVTPMGAACWGGPNNFGQLGDGTHTPRQVPSAVSGLPASITGIAVGDAHSCAVAGSGDIYCWGLMKYGNAATLQSGAVKIEELAGAGEVIAAGGTTACARTFGNNVYCWGGNDHGQLGVGTITYGMTPQKLLPFPDKVTSLALGWEHSCALLEGGAVQCWGANGVGQLGFGGALDKGVPVAVALPPAAKAKQISCAGNVSCAVLSKGTATCWGANQFGQLGNGSTEGKSIPTPVVGLSGPVTSISTSGYRTCAVRDNGEVLCWGENSHGELGTGNTIDSLIPIKVVGLKKAAIQVTTAMHHTCVRFLDGTAQCWGSNDLGELGDNTAWRASPAPVLGF